VTVCRTNKTPVPRLLLDFCDRACERGKRQSFLPNNAVSRCVKRPVGFRTSAGSFRDVRPGRRTVVEVVSRARSGLVLSSVSDRSRESSYRAYRFPSGKSARRRAIQNCAIISETSFRNKVKETRRVATRHALPAVRSVSFLLCALKSVEGRQKGSRSRRSGPKNRVGGTPNEKGTLARKRSRRPARRFSA